MFNIHELKDLYSESEEIIRRAIALYHQKHGGFDLDGPYYPDNLAQDLDDYFQAARNLAVTADRALTAGTPSSFEQLAAQAGQGQSLEKIQEVLGVKGTTLVLTARAVQRGVDLASLVHDATVQAYLNTSAQLNQELVEAEQHDTQWLNQFAKSGQQKDRLLEQLGVPKLDPVQFENLITATISEVRQTVSGTKRGRYATIDVEKYL